MTRKADIQARVNELPDMRYRELSALWSHTMDGQRPVNRRAIETRLAYRLQELAFGGLKPASLQRLIKIGEELDGGDPQRRRTRVDDRPVVGTQLVREWEGVDHVVTVKLDSYEYEGRRYKSLSRVARAITGSSWNGWAFFGLKASRGRR